MNRAWQTCQRQIKVGRDTLEQYEFSDKRTIIIHANVYRYGYSIEKTQDDVIQVRATVLNATGHLMSIIQLTKDLCGQNLLLSISLYSAPPLQSKLFD